MSLGSAQLNSETVNLCQTLRVLVFYSDQNEMCYFVFCWYFTCITCSMSHLSFFLQYMFFFQLPYLPEYVVEMQDFKTLENMFKVLILVMHLRILNLREAGKVGKAFDLFCLPHPWSRPPLSCQITPPLYPCTTQSVSSINNDLKLRTFKYK